MHTNILYFTQISPTEHHSLNIPQPTSLTQCHSTPYQRATRRSATLPKGRQKQMINARARGATWLADGKFGMLKEGAGHNDIMKKTVSVFSFLLSCLAALMPPSCVAAILLLPILCFSHRYTKRNQKNTLATKNRQKRRPIFHIHSPKAKAVAVRFARAFISFWRSSWHQTISPKAIAKPWRCTLWHTRNSTKQGVNNEI